MGIVVVVFNTDWCATHRPQPISQHEKAWSFAMTSCGSVHPHLASLENSRFLAVLGRWLGHGPWGFYRSTRFRGSGAPRRTEKQHILGRVDIPIVDSPAFTDPVPYFQRHGLLKSTARRAGFAGGRPSIHDKHITPIPCGFVLDLPPEFIQATVRYSFTQALVSQHPFDVQILQANHLVLVDQPVGLLVQKITAAILDPGMNSGDVDLLPAPALRAFLLARESALGHFQLPGIAVSVFRRTGFIPLGGDDHILNSHIHAHRIPFGRQGEDFYLAGHAGEIAPAWVFAHRHHLRNAVYLTGPLEFKRPKLGQLQPLTFGVEVLRHMALVQLIAYRLGVVAAFKTRIASTARKEVPEGRILVSELLGMATGGSLTQPGILGLFHCRQLATETDSVQRLSMLLIRLRSGFQGPIPHKAGMTEFNSQLPLLRRRWVEPESIGALCYHTTIVQQPYGNNNGKRVIECSNRVRTQGTASSVSKKRKPHAIKLGRDGAGQLRKTRIHGETKVMRPSRSQQSFTSHSRWGVVVHPCTPSMSIFPFDWRFEEK
ncbi:hypothetical protein Nwat_1899 [Nitrosococcus watsonii C-113]|uniref:Uncharacterized protein n=1 Tax=Nitrosococcus watsoni (strain C-113) TaxID=105559 RepID=D8K768_NITWC|nr:hypothetical protein Nwat_1899 [Nitrosococcus watsonii C-113]